MSDDLEALLASMKRIASGKDQESATRTKALTLAMQGVQVAMSEILSKAEQEADEEKAEGKAMEAAVNRIVRAIETLQIEAPEINLAPVFNVPKQEVNLAPVFNVPKSDVKLEPVFNVPPSNIHLALDRGSVKMDFKFEYQGPMIVGGTATITRGNA